MIKTKKINIIKILRIDLTIDEIKEIIDNNNNLIPIIRNINKIKMKNIFLYKSKNFIFYRCDKRNNWNGKAKVNLPKKILWITEYCKDNNNLKK